MNRVGEIEEGAWYRVCID